MGMHELLRLVAVTSLVGALAACGESSSSNNAGNGNGNGGNTPASTASMAAYRAPGVTISPEVESRSDASCEHKRQLAGGRHYQVTLISASNKTISFEVMEPKLINCEKGNPLVLQGHGFGGSRTIDPAGTFLERLQDNGYAVVSIDQRGFGQSGGTVRVMDPNFEGRDLLQILDWVESHLDYLAHRKQDDDSYNLVAGSIGGSYGGMYQLLLNNIDPKHRLDVLAPDITPHDLRYSLNPNGVIKTGWDLVLVAGGELGSASTGAHIPLLEGLDPVIKETLLRGGVFNIFPDGSLPFFYYHSSAYFLDAKPASEQAAQEFLLSPLSGGLGYDFPAVKPAKVDILFSQGFRDTLFNFNDGWANFLAYRALGGDVRLMTHESGHILPVSVQTLFAAAPEGPLQDGAAQLTTALAQLPVNLPEFQAPAGSSNCGELNKDDATLAFFNQKLNPPSAENIPAEVQSQLDQLKDHICVSLTAAAGSTAAKSSMVKLEDFQAPGEAGAAKRTVADVNAALIPTGNGVLGLLSPVLPTFVPLNLPTSAANLRTVAGIGELDISVNPSLPLNGCTLSALLPGEIPIRGCDSIIWIGIAAKKGLGAVRLLDDQLTPVRGLGAHKLDMTGIAEPLQEGEVLGLAIYGFHPQYPISISRDVLVPAVNVTGKVALPLMP
ncbi:MAG: CocE/NonD family hydrolase [Pedobacter sp.]|nr:CocE/NonD family hydrolase [Pedobacter sp.]